MKVLGLALIVAGWIIATIVSLHAAKELPARFALTIFGIAVSLFGLCGVLNKGHLKHAIWKQTQLR